MLGRSILLMISFPPRFQYGVKIKTEMVDNIERMVLFVANHESLNTADMQNSADTR